jgi:small redox-active disulfide protein 2
MQVEVLGPGCPKCNELAKRTEEVLRELKLDVPVEKVTDLREITKYNVFITPALVVDGVVKVVGKVPSRKEIRRLLAPRKE